MVETLLVGGIVGILTGSIASLITLKIYQRRTDSTVIQQQGWQRAQEARHQQWQIQQEKRAIELEKKLVAHLRQMQQEWHAWEQKDSTRVETLRQQYESSVVHANVEHELARIPRLEEASLPPVGNKQQQSYVPHVPPARLQGTDLSGRDLSRRYLGMADLRGANLTHANLFMADLSGACLAGADLSGADLSGANLTNADLRNAVLSEANVLVADLNNAILIGTNLHKVRNLSTEQIDSAIFDSTRRFDTEIDVTMPRIPSILNPVKSTPSTESAQAGDKAETLPSVEAVATSSAFEEPVWVYEEPTPAETQFLEMLPVTPRPLQDMTTLDAPASLPPPSDDNQHVPEELHLPIDRPESRHTEEFDTATPR